MTVNALHLLPVLAWLGAPGAPPTLPPDEPVAVEAPLDIEAPAPDEVAPVTDTDDLAPTSDADADTPVTVTPVTVAPVTVAPVTVAPATVDTPVSDPAPVTVDAPPADSGRIAGVVKHTHTRAPIEDALVVLRCACLSAPLERMTNARGVYMFEGLPHGQYEIQVLAQAANVSKITQLPRGAKFRANFSVDPSRSEPLEIIVEAVPVSVEDPSEHLGSKCRPHCELPAVHIEPMPCIMLPERDPFSLQRSLLDDAGARELLGGPRVTYMIM